MIRIGDDLVPGCPAKISVNVDTGQVTDTDTGQQVGELSADDLLRVRDSLLRQPRISIGFQPACGREPRP